MQKFERCPGSRMFEFKEKDDKDTLETTEKIEFVWLSLSATFTANICRENP
jgi:hypothetical protein